jgi:lysosomal Pro-X carboxypeptidase
MCKGFASKESQEPKEQAKSLYSIFNVWYNSTGDLKEMCLRGNCGGGDNLGAMDGWNWQSCTEMVMPMCNSGPPNDVFFNNCPATVSRVIFVLIKFV